uniref:BPTI/Kunitz inhibitor domain-containing protein n=1 Tax=Steinernema glaseri TaxID=37863 RepID=A0A1I7YUV6_9BILA
MPILFSEGPKNPTMTFRILKATSLWDRSAPDMSCSEEPVQLRPLLIIWAGLSPEYKAFFRTLDTSLIPAALDRLASRSPTVMHTKTLLLVGFLAFGCALSQRVDWCEYWRRIGKLAEHPECVRGIDVETSTMATARPELPVCTIHSALIQCAADRETCPRSGQVCTQSDGTMCCQSVTDGIPVSHINAKPGSCPPPLGISVLQDSTVGCWLDSNCPGIQKCCLEPNAVTNSATRICRDPIGIPGHSVCNLPLAVGSCTAPSVRFYYDASSGKCNSFTYSGCGGNANNFQSLRSCEDTCHSSGIRGTPACPADANAGLNCLFAHADACKTDADCLGRENSAQPSCCMTTCGYRICYQY